jgi:hypothetical protein
MNLYKISQNVNKKYDTYDSAIVAAESERIARKIHPGARYSEKNGKLRLEYIAEDTWCEFKYVQVQLIGVACEDTKRGVILASYNAG